MSSAEHEARERLRAALWLRGKALGAVFAALDGEKGAVRVVGGAVRDTLLGRAGDTVEVDLATILTPQEVSERARAKGITVIPTGIDFGTVTLVLDGCAFEVTTLRHDVETNGRHAVVRFGTDWSEDARRRDFSLNALYCGPDGELFDPLGGLGDCLDRRVRFIGDAATRIAEDRLRIFRFFRFSASHGGERFDADGLAAAEAAAGDLGPLSAERIGHEMTRILALKHCARTLAAMAGIGLIECPDETLAHLGHYEEVATAPVLGGRLALLLGSMTTKALKTRWRLSNAQLRQAEEVDGAARLIAGERVAEAAYRLPEAVSTGGDVAAARAGWGKARLEKLQAQLVAIRPPDFPVAGRDLMKTGVAPGPELGAMLAALETAWIDSGFTLTRDDLLALAQKRS